MSSAPLTRSRAFQLLLIAVLQLAMAPTARPCDPADGAPMSCCAVVAEAEVPAPAMACHEAPAPAPEPGDEDGCECAMDPLSAPAPKPPVARSGMQPAFVLPPLLVGVAPRLAAEPGRRVAVLPVPGIGPPVHRRLCVWLI